MKLISDISMRIGGLSINQQLYTTPFGPISISQTKSLHSPETMASMRSAFTHTRHPAKGVTSEGITRSGLPWLVARIGNHEVVQIITPTSIVQSRVPISAKQDVIAAFVEALQ